MASAYFLRLVGDDHLALHALGHHAVRDLQHRMALGALADLLPAGHGHRVVVEDLVGDVHPGRDGLADRQQAAVEIGAVADVGEHVFLGGKRLLPDPGHALAAHLGEADGGTVHPDRHEMATDAGHRAGTFRHHRGRVVRAAGTEPGRAVGLDFEHLHRTFLGLQDGQLRVDAGRDVRIQAELAQALGDGARDQWRRQFGIGAQQGIGQRVGERPLAAGMSRLTVAEFADHVGPHVVAPVVQLLLDLVLDHLPLFLDHQDFAQAAGEVVRALRLQRPDHAHLVQADAEPAAGRVVEAQVQQRLPRIVVRLAAGHQPEAVVRPFDRVVVQPVGPDVRQRRVPLVIEEARLLLQRPVGPADVQPAGRHLEVGGNADLDPLRVDHRGGAGLDDLLDRLHAGPHAGVAAQCKSVDAQIQDLLHGRGEENRQATGLEDMVALVGGRRTLGDMVIPGDGNDATPRRRSRQVRMLESVGTAVHARALAVPDTENTVEFMGARRRETQLLGAPERRGRELLVHPRLEHDVLRLQVLAGFPQRLVVAAQRRAAVAADEARRVLAGLRVAQALEHRQFHQRLDAAHEGAPVVERILVVQGDGFEGLADVFG